MILGSLATFGGAFGCQGGGGEYVGKEHPPESGETCNLCTPAIDPTPVNCEREEADLEFLPMPLWDFSSGIARNTYGYTDNSTDYWNFTDTWQPAAEETVRCQGQGPTFAFHMKGGAFLNWGGGMGRHLKCLNGSPASLLGEVKIGDRPGTIERACDATQPLHACDGLHPSTSTSSAYEELSDEEKELLHSACPERDKEVMEADSIGAAAPEEEFLLGMTLDLSEWDGISFWARRGSNDAAAGIRVALGDKRTSDDLSFLQYHINPDDRRFCERNVVCNCPDFSECYPDGCTDQQTGEVTDCCRDMPPRILADGRPEWPICGDFACEDIYRPMQHPDSQTAGTSCTPFNFRGGVQESHCYDPETGPEPYEQTLLCGDHWVHPVRLSTEWRFYKVPFYTLLQEGWAKEQFEFDLTTAAVLRFTWGTGWQDFWVDDVRVYRDRYNTTGDDE